VLESLLASTPYLPSICLATTKGYSFPGSLAMTLMLSILLSVVGILILQNSFGHNEIGTNLLIVDLTKLTLAALNNINKRD